jgi:hypothetical protein
MVNIAPPVVPPRRLLEFPPPGLKDAMETLI